MRPLFFCLFAALAVVPLAGEARDAAPPPVAARKPLTTTHHGVQITDDYAWMRTARPEAVLSKPDLLEPAIKRHLADEKRYATKLLAPNAPLEAQIVAEMKARASVEADTVPENFGPYAYYSRYAPGAERKLHCRRPRDGGPEQILLDENVLAGKRRDFSVDETAISPDHKLFAYTFDVDGSERNTLRIRDLATGRDLADTLLDVRGTPIWSTDGSFIFYVRRDPAKWASTVWRHKLGTPPSQDALVYEEREEGFSVGLSGTLSNRFAFIEIADFSTTQLALIDLGAPEASPRMLTPRSPGVKFGAADLGDRLIVSTNGSGAATWKVTERPLAGGPDAPLADLIASRPDRLIQSVIVYRQHLVRLERDLEKGQQQIVVRRWADGQEHTIAFPEGPARIEILPGEEQDTTTLRFTYETMAQPRQTFDYDMETRARVLRKVRDVPSGHDPAMYVTQRIEATAKDGTKVPVSLLMRKDTPRDGSAALWLLGYGAYGDVDQPEFVPGRLSLVDRGMIYAIAHVRGGGDKGEAWHDAGRLRNKMNTFTDYIAVVEHLIGEGYTSKGKVVGYGASAGGTLMGAVANMRPDLFGAIIAEVPFVDVLNTMLDRSLPLTESGFSEFGNPIDSADDFAVMRAYSPYDNVQRQAYPPMLVEQSLNDSRVPYWEATKWVAKLRAMKTDSNPVILWMKDAGGHSGGSGRFDGLADIAKVYAFALKSVSKGT
ncbi:MAG: S9 family peptidase [Hyphomicrobiales bacterium]|nr:MAG: S9 family peptidase [Hyphomicrobiales bacterium]